MAGQQLVTLRQSDEALFARIMAQIHSRLTTWLPGAEDGKVIDHVAGMSKACSWKVYRLTVGNRRVFFTYLNGKRPPKRLVLAIVERSDDTYDDPKQPHFIEVRNMILDRKFRGDIKAGK